MKHPQLWAVTVITGLIACCFGSVAGDPSGAVEIEAASGHAMLNGGSTLGRGRDACTSCSRRDASTRDARDGGSDARGNGDAGRMVDAPAAEVAATLREASSPVDARSRDAAWHVEAAVEAGSVDAGHDATAVDAADGDAAPVCTYPDAATGTMNVLAEVPGVTIQDFDIDSANVFFTTSAGAILSCPASGCAGSPTTVSGSIPAIDGGIEAWPSPPIWAEGPGFMVRIGLDGLVFAESVPSPPATPPLTATATTVFSINLYSLGRDGSGVRLLQHQEPVGTWDGPYRLAVVENTVLYAAKGRFGNHSGETWLDAVLPGPDGGIGTNNVVLETWNEEYGFLGDSDKALVGSTVYAMYEAKYPNPPGELVALSALPDGGAATPVYAAPPVALFASWSFAASSGFVACSGEVLGPGGVVVVDGGGGGWTSVDAGGAYGLFMCPAGGSCTSPIRVAGVDAKSITALYADSTTLYFTDTSNNLFSCDGATALAGACAPTLLACPAPSFAELRSDASYVYLLKSDGSAIVRIAR